MREEIEEGVETLVVISYVIIPFTRGMYEAVGLLRYPGIVKQHGYSGLRASDGGDSMGVDLPSDSAAREASSDECAVVALGML